ncbi:MAG: hypothetical protein A4E34_01782 [Methanoregula sp. PtaU1.Bin006]|nr:MAG: hypothetical protein A4E33_01843 [Methanoregula sp. PtaB.Bin085]OPY33459.1 MAG: hypothetical protein A4E34_01782 [Methanoregula sp. PtaU1.Bin006]
MVVDYHSLVSYENLLSDSRKVGGAYAAGAKPPRASTTTNDFYTVFFLRENFSCPVFSFTIRFRKKISTAISRKFFIQPGRSSDTGIWKEEKRYCMPTSKKQLVKLNQAKKAKAEELSKQAAAGSESAKKKLKKLEKKIK